MGEVWFVEGGSGWRSGGVGPDEKEGIEFKGDTYLAMRYL